jgi:hypothetical protein
MNYRLNNLAEQIRAIDSKSRRTEDGRILEWASVVEVVAAGAHFAVGTKAKDGIPRKYASCNVVNLIFHKFTQDEKFLRT